MKRKGSLVIADTSMVMTAGDRRAGAWKRRVAVLVAAVSAALVAAACDRVQLLAPTNSTISVNAPTRVLPVGGSTEIQAFVAESSGTPVQNGTTVRFSTTLGTVSPVESQTRNGMAVTTFTGTTSGTAEIRATSGAAGAGGTTTPPPTGTPTPATGTNVVTIAVGTAAVGTTGVVAVRATPASVPSTGGTVELVATVIGDGGRLLPGIPVVFSATQGTLGATTAITNDSGEARTTLATSAQSDVTARVGTITGTFTVTVRTGPSVTLTCAVGTAACTNVGIGQLVTFTATRVATGSNLTSSRLDFGDGESINLGNLSSAATVTHAYASAGTFSARLVATDINGETTTAVQVVQVRGAVGVAVTATNSGRTVTATATVSGAASGDVISYEWTFEGTTPNVVTSTNSATFTYSSAGTKTVSVRAILRDGRTATGSTTIVVP